MSNNNACLTTHVLDTANGCPGAGILVHLYRLADGKRTAIKSTTTNNDGRCDAPLLTGAAMQPGIYELEFNAGDYFRARGVNLPNPAFVDVVSLRFGIATASHYHVPLLVSPWSFSTYRGS